MYRGVGSDAADAVLESGKIEVVSAERPTGLPLAQGC